MTLCVLQAAHRGKIVLGLLDLLGASTCGSLQCRRRDGTR